MPFKHLCHWLELIGSFTAIAVLCSIANNKEQAPTENVPIICGSCKLSKQHKEEAKELAEKQKQESKTSK